MKKRVQVAIVLAVLVLPGLFFLFLKRFARNEYAVPPLYQSGRVDPPAGCGVPSTPYHVPADIMHAFPSVDQDSLSVFYFASGNNHLARQSQTQLHRVEKAFTDDELCVIELDPRREDAGILRCALLMNRPDSAVMVDRKLQIRGYYDITSAKDTDRLLAEIMIILRKY